MKYVWEKFAEGVWQTISATALPESLKNKKVVMWATCGTQYVRASSSGTDESYRLARLGESKATKEWLK